MSVKILFGPPGTGKSTKLIDILEEEMANGVEPDKLAFASFTRKAVQEVLGRVRDQFRLSSTDFPYFKTLHSLAYSMMGILHTEVMQTEHYKDLGELLGLEFSGKGDYEEGASTAKFIGDVFVYIEGYARARKISYEDAWRKLEADNSYNWLAFNQFYRTLHAYKKDRGLFDFADFLESNVDPLDIDVAIIDEAQDLSTVQWEFALRVFSRAKRIYIAGDDDQAIYNWSGADVRAFLSIPGEKITLDQSFRVPNAVHAVAEEIAGRIGHRFNKAYKPSGKQGFVEYYRYLDDIDFSSGSWMLLARNAYHLAHLSRLMRTHGYLYSYRGSSTVNKDHINAITVFEAWRKGSPITVEEALTVAKYMPKEHQSQWPNVIWHEALIGIPLEDRAFYISLLRRGERINRTPRIHINTIHAVKGGEADNVLLLTDMTTKTHGGMQTSPDNEHRVWYVGATRCKEGLHIVLPHTKLFYDLC